MSEIVRLENLDSGVARLVIDNPQARNGLTAASCRQLAARIESLADAGGDARVIVLEGAGGHFCSGADLRSGLEMLKGDDAALRSHVAEGFHAVIRALQASRLPTLAVIRGACVGFGFDMALACDLRICAADAKFGQVFSRIGLVPDGGSSFILPRLVGLGRAMELMLLAETFDGATAHDYGLVNRVVPREELGALADDWAGRLAAGPPLAYRLGRANLRAGAAAGTLQQALEREADAQLRCLRSGDMLRGVQAFFTKQKPTFEGR